MNQSNGLYESQSYKAKSESQQHKNGEDKRTPLHVRVLTDWLVLLVSVVTLGLLIATVIYTRRQWLQANRSANASETAANAAQSAATTATQTLKEMQSGKGALDTHTIAQTTKDALVEVQRAVMSADNLLITREIKDGKIAQAYIFVKWKNSGSTPTKNLKIHHSYLPSTTSMPEDFTYPDIWNPGEPHVYTPAFATSQNTITTDPTIINADTIRAVQNHQLRLILWGKARYRDVFKKTPNHISEYCIEITGFYGDPLSINPADQVAPTTSNCKTHNCHDDECKVK